MSFFSINFEFDRSAIFSLVENSLENEKFNYVCLIDGNSLAFSYKNKEYLSILNKSLVNCCDGKSILLLIYLVHGIKLNTFTGPEFFSKYLSYQGRHLFLGNVSVIKKKIENHSPINLNNFFFKDLPFCSVDDFEYLKIAEFINSLKPDFVWVCLGAPKQELFINKISDFVESGLFVGIGGGINLYFEGLENKRAPIFIRTLGLEWVFRVFREPSRIGFRAINYILLIPKILFFEVRNKF